jgi:hypothetical protein
VITSGVDTSDSFARVAMVARALTGRVGVSEIVEIVVHQGMSGLDADGAVFTAMQPPDTVVPVGAVGYTPAQLTALGPLRIDRPLPIPTAARERAAVYVPTLADGIARFPELAKRPTSSLAWAAIPAMVDGQVLGVFGVSFQREHEFSPTDRMFLEALVDVSAAAIACRLSVADDMRQPPVDLRAVMVSVASTFPALTHRVRATSGGGPAAARVDAEKVSAIIDHLVRNAVRHTLPGSTVHVHCAGTGGVVTITVDDEGPGLSPTRRRSVFEPLADGTRGGLAQARDLARADGGNLVCGDAPEHGARFVLTYPAA